jgi:DNA polymerase V
MVDQLSLDLVRKRLVTDAVEIVIGYDHTGIPKTYAGELVKNYYGRNVPKSAHGIRRLGRQTASTKLMTAAAMQIFAQAVDPALLIRRINVIAHGVIPEQSAEPDAPVQYGLFEDVEALERRRAQENVKLQRERQLQEALVTLKGKFGKNAVLRGMNFEEGATARERNAQVGGHRA